MNLDWLVEPCDTCNGHGMVTHAKAETTLERAILHDCPDCAGSGVVPSEQAIEIVARKWFDIVGERSGVDLAFETAYDSEQADFREQASRLLVALLEGTE